METLEFLPVVKLSKSTTVQTVERLSWVWEGLRCLKLPKDASDVLLQAVCSRFLSLEMLYLSLGYSRGIRDIRPLAALTKLQTLNLQGSNITDIEPLATADQAAET